MIDKDKDYYIINNKTYVRVTRVLGVVSEPTLAVWKAKLGERATSVIAKKAANFGTKVHEICQSLAENKAITIPIKYNKQVDRFKEFLDINVQKILYTEKTVHSEEVAGTVDLIYLHKDNSIRVLDIKTGTIKENLCRMQTAIYQYMIENNLSLQIACREILPLSRKRMTKKLNIKTYDNNSYQNDLQAFKGLLTYYLWNKIL